MEANPYQKAAPMTKAQNDLIQKENEVRNQFAEKRNSLSDPHILLHNVYESSLSFDYQLEDNEELLTHHRRLDLTGSSIVSKDQFLKHLDEFTQNISWDNLFIAGGAILGCLSSNQDGYRSSDIDLFIHGIDHEEAANEKIVQNTGGKGEVIRTNRALTILCAFPFRHIQIILRLYKSPAEVLLGFDIDSCCVGYDGKDVWCQERFHRAVTKRYNLVNISRRSLTYEQRLFKYSKRGFCVAVPNLNKAFVDVSLFQKQARDVVGLARLLLYDYTQGAGKSTFSRFPRKDQDSDYNNDLPIPWGPEWKNEVIINMLLAKNKTNFFSSLKKSKAVGDTLKYSHMYTGNSSSLETGQFNTWTRSLDGKSVDKPLEWIKDMPAYQDFDNGFKRLMTVDDSWDKGVYTNNTMDASILMSKPFSTDDSSSKDFKATAEHAALPFQQVKTATKAKKIFDSKPTKSIQLTTTKAPPVGFSFGSDKKAALPKASKVKQGTTTKAKPMPTSFTKGKGGFGMPRPTPIKPSTDKNVSYEDEEEPEEESDDGHEEEEEDEEEPKHAKKGFKQRAKTPPNFQAKQQAVSKHSIPTQPAVTGSAGIFGAGSTTMAAPFGAFGTPNPPFGTALSFGGTTSTFGGTTSTFGGPVPPFGPTISPFEPQSNFASSQPSSSFSFAVSSNSNAALPTSDNSGFSFATATQATQPSTVSGTTDFYSLDNNKIKADRAKPATTSGSTQASIPITASPSFTSATAGGVSSAEFSLAAFNGGVSPQSVFQMGTTASAFNPEPTSPYKPDPVVTSQPSHAFASYASYTNPQNSATLASPFVNSQPSSLSSATSFQSFQPSSSTSQPASSKSHTTKLLLLIALCYKKNLISNDEKSTLKDLVLSRNDLPNSALEVFEVDQDLDELADTLRRICKYSTQ